MSSLLQTIATINRIRKVILTHRLNDDQRTSVVYEKGTIREIEEDKKFFIIWLHTEDMHLYNKNRIIDIKSVIPKTDGKEQY